MPTRKVRWDNRYIAPQVLEAVCAMYTILRPNPPPHPQEFQRRASTHHSCSAEHFHKQLWDHAHGRAASWRLFVLLAGFDLSQGGTDNGSAGAGIWSSFSTTCLKDSTWLSLQTLSAVHCGKIQSCLGLGELPMFTDSEIKVTSIYTYYISFNV